MKIHELVAQDAVDEVKQHEEAVESARAVRTRELDGYVETLVEVISAADGMAYRAWLRDGEAVADMKWQFEPADGWPEELR